MTTARVAAAAPDLAIGAGFLLTWLQPRWLGVHMLEYATLSMLLEFIVVHSAAFMGVVALSKKPRGWKALGMIGLGAFYSTFLIGFALAFRTWWPLIAFWTLTGNRMATMLLRDADDEPSVAVGWTVSMMLYMFWVFFALLVPLPRLGVSDAVVAEAALPGSGEWIEAPHKAIASGAGYFLSQACWELNPPAWTRSVRDALKKGNQA